MSALLLISVLTVAVPDRQDPTVKVAEPLQEQLLGEWRVTRRVAHGTEDGNSDSRSVFTAGTMQHLNDNGTLPWSKFTYTLDTTKIPATIILDKNVTGIFKIEADVLTICFGRQGITDFKSTPDSATILLVLTRVRK